ncbi:protein AMN1 homolog [Parambassis ranga]|uniref:Protein AMN1 homolog n=1 Tax=Parambassis ranga TaxID=210632 RepID=A0A6P7IFA9_9TELE|nr:uncharacterized protein LOC114437656 [Parambassis ranga]
MDSYAFMNGQLQHIGPTSQTPQATSHHTRNTITNHQAGAANNSYQYGTLHHRAQPPQTTHFNLHNGAHTNRQASNWHTSAGPNQVLSSQQTEEWKMNSHCLVAANQPNQSNNVSPFSCYSISGLQGSSMNLTTQTSSNSINNAYGQQQLLVNKRQTVNIQNPPNGRAPQGWYQNANCVLMQPIPTTTLSLPCEQAVYTNTLASATIHRESAQYQIPRQNNTQNQYIPSNLLPPYNRSQKTHYNLPQFNQTNALNLPVTQQQPLRHKMPPDSAYESSGHPSYSASACRVQQFVSNAQATGQNTPPVTSGVLEHRNLNIIQSLALNFGTVMSRTQPVANSSLQPNVVPNAPCLPSAGDKSGKIQADNPVCLKSKGKVLELLSDSSLLRQVLEKIPSKTNGTQSSLASSSKIAERSDMLETVNVNDGSIHMSHGHTGTRVVAVVQPLSQESSQIACQQTSNTTKDDFLYNPEKVLCSPVTEHKESSLYPENQDQMMSSQAVDGCSSNDGSLLSSSDLGPPESMQTSDLNVNITLAGQVKAHSQIPERQNSPEQNSAMETPAETFQLSSLPTNEITLTQATCLTQLGRLVALKKLKQSTAVTDAFQKMIEIYWNNSIKALISKIKTGCHADVVSEAEHFCKTHLTPDSIILRQVKRSHRKYLKNMYVLEDNEVYSEPPYKSSWLNVNEKLDDIDKEFGFPLTMTFHSDMQDGESQSHPETTIDSTPESAVNEEPNVLSQAEPESVDLKESKEENSTAADTSTQPVSPNMSESDMSSDPHYSFKIEVLSPEEARLFFDQAQSETPQITDTVEELESQVSSVSVECVKAENTDVTLSEANPKDRTVCPIEQFCCVTKWVASILESDSAFSIVCDCKEKQSEKEGTDGNLEKEDEGVQTKIIDLTEDNDQPCSSSDEETKNSTSQSSIIPKSKTEDGNSSSSDGDVFSQLEDDLLELLNCTVTMESGALISENKQTESTNEVVMQRSDTEEGCGEAKQKSAGAAESPQQTKEQTQVQTPFSRSQVQKRPRSEDDTTFRKELKKRKLHANHNTQLEKSGKMAVAHTVKLTLFGSTKRSYGISSNEKKLPFISLHSARERPPEVLSVNVSSFKKKSSDQLHRGGYSVKQWLHESWRRSFLQIKHSHRNVLKTKTHPDASSSRVCLKKEKWTASPQKRVGKGKVTSQSLNKQRLCQKKTKKDVTREEPEDDKGSNTKDHAMPAQLRFSMLSETFNFKEGTNRQKETTCPVSDKPALIKEKNQSRHKAVMKPKGTWCPNERKRHLPSPVPKTTVTFQEFKKRYKEKTQASTDE